MPRIAGVDIPENKRMEVALTYLYGIGPATARNLLGTAHVDPNKRARQLTGTEIQEISRELAKYTTEGDLRKQIRDNIERLKRIGSYRGLRHQLGLPVRGQRTRTNARTKRGKRVTIGAMKKEDATKREQATKTKATQ